MKSLEEYIYEQLYTHLNIDYKLFENAGLYDGIEDLCMFLTNKIKSHQEKNFTMSYKNDDKQLSKFKNIFFKEIIIECERENKNKNDGEYHINKSEDYDSNTSLFNFVKLSLSLSQTHKQGEVFRILLHEITHAWDNFNSYKKGTTSLNDAVLNTNYREVLKDFDSEDNVKRLIGQILYFTSKIELNSFNAEFAGYLYDYIEDNTIANPHKALSIIKSSDLYNNYIKIGEIIEMLYNEDKRISNKFVYRLCNEYNKLNNTDYTEYKIKKQLYTRYKQVINKINSNIGKLCTRYIKELTIH